MGKGYELVYRKWVAKAIKICSAAFPNKNVQIKMRHDFSPIRLANIETSVTYYLQECRKMDISCILLGTQISVVWFKCKILWSSYSARHLLFKYSLIRERVQ